MGRETTGGRRCKMVLGVNEELAEVKGFVRQKNQLLKSPPSDVLTGSRPLPILHLLFYFSCETFNLRLA